MWFMWLWGRAGWAALQVSESEGGGTPSIAASTHSFGASSGPYVLSNL